MNERITVDLSTIGHCDMKEVGSCGGIVQIIKIPTSSDTEKVIKLCSWHTNQMTNALGDFMYEQIHGKRFEL